MQHHPEICKICALPEQDRYLFRRLVGNAEPFHLVAAEFGIKQAEIDVHLADAEPELRSGAEPDFEDALALFAPRDGVPYPDVLRRRLSGLVNGREEYEEDFPEAALTALHLLSDSHQALDALARAYMLAATEAARFDFSGMSMEELNKFIEALPEAVPNLMSQKAAKKYGHAVAAMAAIAQVAFQRRSDGKVDWVMTDDVLAHYFQDQLAKKILDRLGQTRVRPLITGAKYSHRGAFELTVGDMIGKDDGGMLQAAGFEKLQKSLRRIARAWIRDPERKTRLIVEKPDGGRREFSSMLGEQIAEEISLAIARSVKRHMPATAIEALAMLETGKFGLIWTDVHDHLVSVFRAGTAQKRAEPSDARILFYESRDPNSGEAAQLLKLAITKLGELVCRNAVDRIIWRDRFFLFSGRTNAELREILRAEAAVEISEVRVYQITQELMERARKEYSK